MRQITNKEYEEWQKYKAEKAKGHILLPDTVRFICEAPLLALAAVPCLAQDPATNAPADSLIREIALRESSKNVKLHEHILDCFTAGTNALAKGFHGIALAKFEEMERVASLVNGLPAVENLADIREQARKLAKEIRQTADPRHRLSGTVSKIVPNATNDDFEDGERMSYDLVSIQVEEVDSVPRQFQFDVLCGADDSSATNLQPGARISFSMTMLPDDNLSTEFFLGALQDIKVLSPPPATPASEAAVPLEWERNVCDAVRVADKDKSEGWSDYEEFVPSATNAPAVDGAKEPATNENAALMGDVVLFPNDGPPTWKFRPIRWPGETNVSTDVFPVEPASPPFDLIGTWCRTTADFLLRIRMAGEGIQPIAELWQSANEHNPNQGQLFIDWSPGTTEIAAGIELHPDSASGLVLDFWSWETKVGKERALGPGMLNADFGESPVFASVHGKSVHPFALSHSSSNGVLQASTWSDPVQVATHPVFRVDGVVRLEEGNAVSGSALEKELRSFPTPSACLRNVPLGEIVDLLGHVFRSERVCAGEPSRSAVEGGAEWFLPFFEGSSDGPDPERLVKCSGFGNLPERFVSDPRISAYVRDADALTFLKQIAAAANGGVSVIDGGVRIFVPAPPATNAPAAPAPHADSAAGAKDPAP